MTKSSEDIVFYKKGGRPKELTKKEAYESQLMAKREWREKNRQRISKYNEMYREKSKKKSTKGSKKHSKKHSSKGSKHSRKGSRKHSRKGSRKHSRKGSKHSRKGSKHHSGGSLSSKKYAGHTVTLLRVNPDGSRIVLVK